VSAAHIRGMKDRFIVKCGIMQENNQEDLPYQWAAWRNGKCLGARLLPVLVTQGYRIQDIIRLSPLRCTEAIQVKKARKSTRDREVLFEEKSEGIVSFE